MKRYARNFGTLSEEGQKTLCSKKVLVIGSGGLGGFVIEGLSRMGVKTIGVCDYDVFDITNLNRQLFATEDVIGTSKVDVAKKRIGLIDKTIDVITYKKAFPCEEIENDINMYDLVVDCLDNMKSRIILEEFCLSYDKKLIHGAIGGFYGTVAVVSKENKIIEKLSVNLEEGSDTTDKIMGNPFQTVAFVGAMEVHLAISVLLSRKYLEKGFYYIDVEDFSIDEVVI